MITPRPQTRFRLLAALLALGVAAASCGDAEQAAPDEETTTTTDAPQDDDAGAVAFVDESNTPCLVSEGGQATGKPIKVGSIQSLRGLYNFSSSGQGAKAFFECVNANGGINGRPIEFIVEDDKRDTDRAREVAERLVEEEGVVGMVASASYVDCAANADYYEKNDVLALYGAGLSQSCFSARNIAPINSGPRISALGIAQYMAEQYDATSIACVSQNDDTNIGRWTCDGLEAWGATAGVTVTSVLHSAAQPDVTNIVNEAMAARPDAVVLIEPVARTVAILDEAKAQDLRTATHWGTPTYSYVDGFPEEIGEYWWGYIDMQAELTLSNAPTTNNKAWLATMEQYGEEGDQLDTFSQAGWLAARIFTDTILDVDPDTIDRAVVSEAIRDVTTYPTDLGCGSWYFGPGDRHNPNHAGRIVTVNVAGLFELVKECHEHDDPELADVLAFELEHELG